MSNKVFYEANRHSRLTEMGREAAAHGGPPPSFEDFMIWEHAYNHGYMQAIDDFGIWKNGEQTIGCMCTPVKDIVKMIKETHGKLE